MFGLDTDLLIQATYLVTAALFILGLKRMSSPVTARSGILWAGAGMLVATLITFLAPGIDFAARASCSRLFGFLSTYASLTALSAAVTGSLSRITVPADCIFFAP